MTRARHRAGWVRASCLLILGAASSACGYSTGLGISKANDSVGLEFFGNTSLERDLEPLLHDHLSRALRDFADVPIEEPRDADIVMRGTIRTYQRRGGIRSTENVLLETGVYIDVEASLYSKAAGAAVKGPARASTWVGFVIEGAESERDARDRGLRRVAEELVLELFAPIQ